MRSGIYTESGVPRILKRFTTYYTYYITIHYTFRLNIIVNCNKFYLYFLSLTVNYLFKISNNP